MSKSETALLALADGSIFVGKSIGMTGLAVGEVIFNTSMTGYQEILTDPSYAQQIVTLTYPHIGNVGTNSEDQESSSVWASGLIIRDLSPVASNWRSQQPLGDYLRERKIVGIAGIDTRRLTRILRDKGAQNGCIIAGENPDPQQAIQAAQKFPGLNGADLAKEVSVSEPYVWQEGSWTLQDGYRKFSAEQLPYHVVAYDYGVKQNILRLLVDRGCRVTVVPATTSAEEVLAMQPNGIFLSNGPGDPAACSYAIESIKTFLQSNVPIFGICLGHQLLGLACGAKTIKMKFGHHGANHPISELETGRVFISSQNHGFEVEEATLPSSLKATHRSLFDGSLQGIAHTSKPAFSFQGHPEASPGPNDLLPLFDQFIELIKQYRG